MEAWRPHGSIADPTVIAEGGRFFEASGKRNESKRYSRGIDGGRIDAVRGEGGGTGRGCSSEEEEEGAPRESKMDSGRPR